MTHATYAAEVFGLEVHTPKRPAPAMLPMPEPGQVLAIVGPSGSGKTLALCALGAPREAKSLTRGQLAKPVLDLFDAALPSAEVLRALARVGLADGRLWAMRAGGLSAGEQRRLELALALAGANAGELLVADEFDAHLDVTTACVIAQNLQRAARRAGLRLAVSTHRLETLPYLAPDNLLEIERGVARELPLPPVCDIAAEIEITRGTLADYAPFEHWHYLGPGRPGPTSDVFVARNHGRAVGIVLFGFPHLLLGVRAKSLPQFSVAQIRAGAAAALNREVRLLQRVIVEPRYRGIGVASALIKHGLRAIDARYVECIAQMGEFSEFLRASGFARAGEIEPPQAARALLAFTARHGISPEALVSSSSRRAVLRALPQAQSARLSRKIKALAQSRIQTGFGSRRKSRRAPESLLRRALARVNARPAYFLWTRGAD